MKTRIALRSRAERTQIPAAFQLEWFTASFHRERPQRRPR